jgi:hypothetical protein
VKSFENLTMMKVKEVLLNYPPGIYFIRTQSGREIKTVKIWNP